MKRVVKFEESEKSPLEEMAGQYVQLWCLNYIYSGKLVGVNDSEVILVDSQVVYETGKLIDKGWNYSESTGVDELVVRLSAIESYSLAPQLVTK